MRLFVTALIFTILCLPLFSQTNISGIINNYNVATGYDECTNELQLSSTDGFDEGMKVIIIQMQGAEISNSNDETFGNISAYNSAGKYEEAVIQSISPTGIILENEILNDYDFNGRVQAVSLPVYESVYVNGTLTAQAWNGQTGGILALEVTGQMITDADIDVSGLGFRGGISSVASNNCTWLTNADNYSYQQSDWRGAPKGEGIAIIGSGQENGRGAQANGGGGGNDHNSGGGGGSHISIGGQGGTNNEPSFFGCDGTYPGLGGKSLSGSGDRLFMGGGGGAGHENNDVGTDGGNGGGIVIIKAAEFAGLGYSIRANGTHAENSEGDGAGGGGAAGTIIFQVETASGFHFEVLGGNGGNADNENEDRCNGPGGGGSGGRIIASASISVSPFGIMGGTAGMSFNSNSCDDSNNGATNGSGGVIESIDELVTSTTPFTAPAIISQVEAILACEQESISFPVEIQGTGLNFQWQADDGSGFEDLPDSSPYSQTNSNELHISTIDNSLNGYQFRLVISGECTEDIISEPIPLVIFSPPVANFSYATDELTVSFTNFSTDADSYLWDFGDTQQSTLENPEHTYSEYGSYTIMMISTNECGPDTAFTEINFVVPIEAGFTHSDAAGCAPFQVEFSNQSTGTFDELMWEFPGGTPGSSSEENPVIIYETPGTYNVSLTASNSSGSNTYTLENTIEILAPPTPLFSAEIIDDLVVSFTNNSQNAVNYFWTFGDGNTSMEENPVHEYAEFGDYEVTLNAENPYCSVSASQDIFLVTNIDQPEEFDISIAPNPVKNTLLIEWPGSYELNVQIFSAGGKMVFHKNALQGSELDVSNLPGGLYFLKYFNQNGQGQVKFIKM